MYIVLLQSLYVCLDAEVIPLDPDRAKELAESMDQLDDELQALFDGFEQQVK